jgi:hypothetical protein
MVSYRGVARALTVIGTVIAAVALIAGPAQAATVQYKNSKWSSKCMSISTSSAAGPAVGLTCSSSSTSDNWTIIGRGTSTSGRALQQLQNASNGRCLDSHAALAGGTAYVIGCNSGNYQVWEIFLNSGGTRTFKSWGAWTLQNSHVCLQMPLNGGDLKMATCNTGSTDQRWS